MGARPHKDVFVGLMVGYLLGHRIIKEGRSEGGKPKYPSNSRVKAYKAKTEIPASKPLNLKSKLTCQTVCEVATSNKKYNCVRGSLTKFARQEDLKTLV